jgi:predicted DCC family thiol-disulfide oxidoreductase YuxK
VTRLLIVYDGACPFCSAYASLLRLREQMQIELLSARSDDLRIDGFRANGYRLDEGMLLQINGEVFVGAEAMHRLAILSTRDGMLNNLQRIVFAQRWLAHALYPWLRLGRRLALLLRRVPLIDQANHFAEKNR